MTDPEFFAAYFALHQHYAEEFAYLCAEATSCASCTAMEIILRHTLARDRYYRSVNEPATYAEVMSPGANFFTYKRLSAITNEHIFG